MATTTEPEPLIGEELEEVFGLIRDADSVELKLTVPEADHRSTVVALGMDPLDAEIRQVFFFDTPDLALNENGVVVRARRVQRKGDDSVVKLRPVVPSELPDTLRSSPNLVVEVDAMAGRLCLLGLAQGHPRLRSGPEDRPGGAPHPQALLEGAAGLLRRARSGGPRARRPVRAGADLRPQAEVQARGLRGQARRRAVELPGWLSDPRALDEMRSGGGSPGLVGLQGVLARPWGRAYGRAADEGEDRARVLLEEPRHCVLVGERGERRVVHAHGRSSRS